MTSCFELLKLLEKINIKNFELDNLLFGTIEVRNNKYIYIHKRIDGIQHTKYVGEYSEILYEMIVNNNKKARKLKKEKRLLNKKLKDYDYVDKDLSKIVKLNIDFARKQLSNTIYNQAILEGVATTFLETENIIEEAKINNMNTTDVMKIINLKHAWEFILNKDVIRCDTDINLLKNINKLIEEGFYYSAGEIRISNVKIGGTSWTPEIPDELLIKEKINKIINSNKTNIDKAIDLLLFTSKGQIFIDGNKRTSIVFVNHFLISKGLGLLVVPSDYVDEYKKLLIEYYETNKSDKISKFLKQKCYLKLKK